MKKKIFFGLLIFILTFTLYSWLKIKEATNTIFIGKNSTTVSATDLIKGDFDQKTPFNIALLGYGGGNHDGAYLTDSIIVAHIDPSSKTTTLISIPRDIWVKIPTNGTTGSSWKINAAYELGLDDNDYPSKQIDFKGPTGGGNMAKYVIGSVTGLNIDRFIALDFNGFKNTIDTLGGVDINVETTFDDYEYPIDGKENDLCGHNPSELPDLIKIATVSATQAFPCRYEHLHFDQGLQHMDGETALSYVRSRHSLQDGTDFGRSKRQRNLIVAVKSKIFSVGFIPKIFPFISSLKDDLSTDLTPEEVKLFVDKASELNSYKVQNLALTDQNVLKDSVSDDGQFILVPADGSESWESVHNWISANLDPNHKIASPAVEVENGTHIAGLAALASNRLQDQGFSMQSPENTDIQAYTQTKITVYRANIDPVALQKLEKEFNVSTISLDQKSNPQYDILVIVGEDYNNLQGKKLINE